MNLIQGNLWRKFRDKHQLLILALSAVVTLSFSSCRQGEILITSPARGSLLIEGKTYSIEEATDLFTEYRSKIEGDVIELTTQSTQKARELNDMIGSCAAAGFIQVVIELKDRRDIAPFRYAIPTSQDSQFLAILNLPWDGPEGVFAYRDEPITKSAGEKQHAFRWLKVNHDQFTCSGKTHPLDELPRILAEATNASMIVIIDPATDLTNTAKVINALNESKLKYFLSLQ